MRIARMPGTGRPWWGGPAVAVLGLAAASALTLAGAGQASAQTLGGAVRASGGPGDVVRVQTSAHIDHWGAFFGNHKSSEEDVTLSPTPINLPDPAAEVGTSNSTQYALLTNGTVWAWGQGTNGQLGNGGTANSFSAAVQVQFPAGVQIAYIPTDAMPYDTGLAVDTKGNAWGWGLNRNGSLCLGNNQVYLKPVQLPFTDVTTLAGAGGHAVYDADGTVESCGTGAQGVLGDGRKTSSKVPVKVHGLDGSSVTELVSAFENAGALLSNGEYFDWGYDAQGQLGNGTVNQPSDVPVQVTIPDSSPVAQVVQGGSQTGNGQTFAMLADGSLYAWGNDWESQLGDGQTGMRAKPELISPPAGVTYSLLATGGDTSYGVTAAGDVYAWGSNEKGQVGNGTRTRASTPVKVESGATMISSTANDVVIGGDPG
jgi:alpha-tubulin suppressor-like RCC1 family protein